MDTQRDDSIPERLKKLEGEVQRLSRQRYMAVALGLFAILYIVSKDLSPPRNGTFGVIRAKAVVAEQFRVGRDPPTSEIVLEIDDHSNPHLMFFDSRRCRLNLGIREEGPDLAFYDHEGNGRVSIGVYSDRGEVNSRMQFFDPKPSSRLEIGMMPGDRPIIAFMDNKSHIGMDMFMDSGGRSELLMKNADGTGYIQLQTSLDSDPTLFLAGKDNRIHHLQRGEATLKRREEPKKMETVPGPFPDPLSRGGRE